MEPLVELNKFVVFFLSFGWTENTIGDDEVFEESVGCGGP